MINIDIDISLPDVWGEKSFKKNVWAPLNILVGPNATGKTLFAEQLLPQLQRNGYNPRPLYAERLYGLEKQSYSHFGSLRHGGKGINIDEFDTLKSQGAQFGLAMDSFIILKERLDVRIRIEAILSDIFKKNIHLVEQGGFLKPKMQDIKGGDEYALQESECHGLKELITLLTFLYDKTYDTLIFDEPELHLHPQFQSFFLDEIRKISGDPKVDGDKKLFYIITHSPFFLDLRTIDDLKNVLVFHFDNVPSYIDSLDPEDEWRLKKFLPRFNTHHKQFFFSPNPVFVEGYTDQQIVTILFDKLSKNISASGSCAIDVGGKDELDVFFRICDILGINASFIADLDVLFKGKLRQTVSLKKQSKEYLQECGIGVDLNSTIGILETRLKGVADEIISCETDDDDLKELIECLKTTDREELHKIRCIVLQGLVCFKEKILDILSYEENANAKFLYGRYIELLNAFEKCRVFLLEKGTIENYYIKNNNNFYVKSKKDVFFHEERDYILKCDDIKELNKNYSELISLLNKTVPEIFIDIDEHLKFEIIRWIQKVQWCVAKGEISNLEQLKYNARIQYSLYNQILDVLKFEVEENKSFNCKIQLKIVQDVNNKQVVFSEKTVPHKFNFHDSG